MHLNKMYFIKVLKNDLKVLKIVKKKKYYTFLKY